MKLDLGSKQIGIGLVAFQTKALQFKISMLGLNLRKHSSKFQDPI